MKKLISVFCIVALLLLSVAAAFAAPDIQSKTLFSNQATSATTAAFPTGLRTKKTVFITGMTAANAFTNYSGTVTLYCAPTGSGPWPTCKDKAMNTVTLTDANGYFVLDDSSQFIRAVWTKTRPAAAKNIGVYLLYSE